MVTQWTSTVTGTNIIQKSDGKWENQNSLAFQKQIGTYDTREGDLLVQCLTVKREGATQGYLLLFSLFKLMLSLN